MLGVQVGAWLARAADSEIRQNRRARVSLLSWRSSRLKRVVASAGAAEALSLSAAVAEAQWLQVLWRNLIFMTLPDRTGILVRRRSL